MPLYRTPIYEYETCRHFKNRKRKLVIKTKISLLESFVKTINDPDIFKFILRKNSTDDTDTVRMFKACGSYYSHNRIIKKEIYLTHVDVIDHDDYTIITSKTLLKKLALVREQLHREFCEQRDFFIEKLKRNNNKRKLRDLQGGVIQEQQQREPKIYKIKRYYLKDEYEILSTCSKPNTIDENRESFKLYKQRKENILEKIKNEVGIFDKRLFYNLIKRKKYEKQNSFNIGYLSKIIRANTVSDQLSEDNFDKIIIAKDFTKQLDRILELL